MNKMDNLKAYASSSSMGDSSSCSQSSGNEEENNNNEMFSDLRRGPWTVEEDFILMNYISLHGEGRWNSLANSAGLKRTGKSCRLRWLNYLRPDVRRGNITLEEQLLILDLHSRWGNRWSKIAQYLPGRTDNEIKNYWRTRVQKHAKQLKCDVNSKQFKDTMRYLWMPRLLERIQAAAAAAAATATTTTTGSAAPTSHLDTQCHHNIDMGVVNHLDFSTQNNTTNNYGNIQVINQNNFITPENSTTCGGGSIDSSEMTQQVISPISEPSDCYNHEFYQPTMCDSSFNQGFDYLVDHNNQWMDSGNISDSLWNMDDAWFLQQQLNIL